MPQDYNSTINLPKTDFPMRAGLPKREPEMLKSWEEMDLYGEIQKKNAGRPTFVLHDGPPFSNGKIHMGTALNKSLKDFIVRYKSMTGYRAPYQPGWDNHGMPIESAIIKQNKLDRKRMSIPEFRDACHAFADKFVHVQMEQFQRLGVLGDWEHPYLTMDPAFEAEEVRVFGEMYEKGYIYKGLKPVYWCPNDETALAEAEIEYQDDPCTTVYVKFPMHDDLGKLPQYDHSRLFFVIWTTTIWTLPGNVGIALHPRDSYAIVKCPNGEHYIMAEALVDKVMGVAGIEGYEIVETQPGSFFEYMLADHPFLPKTSQLMLAEYVTMDSGTGCVHTAPGFGADDYQTCRRYNVELVVPVDDQGRHTDYAGKYAGLKTDESNPIILEDMRQAGSLLASEEIVHSYTHCWRCKGPIIFRATPQWFCSVDAFKDQAVAVCDGLSWNPEWGHDRMVAMIRERADWCISRQRHWGLPIPVFYCSDCGKPVCTPETIDKVSKLFGEHGSNVWFDREAAELLPEGFTCPHCGGVHFTKETDTLDGWFDSGSSHRAALEKYPGAAWPADLYLEGGDQYRGWFQSSLLTSVGTRGKAPYKGVLTHGWTVDGEGRAMHKSLGNSILPDEVIPKYGADLIRLWAASSDYHLDMRCSDAIFKQLSDKYLKIRNTARFMLGNLDGFDPERCMDFSELEELDQWAVSRLQALLEKCRASYDAYEFYAVTYAIHNFCVVDLSSFYLDIVKDRLYCEEKDGAKRRSAQSAMFLVLDTLVRLLAPILAFTSNEIWLAMPHRKSDDARHVMLNDIPDPNPAWRLSDEKAARWDGVIALRTDVNKALELARAEKVVGKSLDAKIVLSLDEKAKQAYEAIAGEDLMDDLIVSELAVSDGPVEGYAGTEFPGVCVHVEPSTLEKCPRCWKRAQVGTDPRNPELCPRCAAVVAAM